MPDETSAPRMFNPHQLRILRFEQRETADTKDGAARWTYEATLALGEARRAGLTVTAITFHAEGSAIERMTQQALIDMMTDTVIEALARERAGIRPGTPSAALPALPARAGRHGQ